MYLVIVWIVAVFAVALLMLTAFTLLHRLVVDARTMRQDRMRHWMERRVQLFLFSQDLDESLLADIPMHHPIALEALLSLTDTSNAFQRLRLTPIFRLFGFSRQEIVALNHRRWHRRMLAADRLGVMAVQEAIVPLVRALKDDILEVRITAARSLARLRVVEAIEPILHALEVRGDMPIKSAVDVLEGYGEAAVSALMDFLRRRKPGSHGVAAAVALNALGLQHARIPLETLGELIKEPDFEVRVSAARAMGASHDRDALQLLIQACRDGVWQVRSAAAHALGELGDAQAIATLNDLLADHEWWVRHNAAESLLALSTEGLKQLFDAAYNHRDRFARDVSRELLEWHDLHPGQEVLSS